MFVLCVQCGLWILAPVYVGLITACQRELNAECGTSCHIVSVFYQPSTAFKVGG